MGVEQALLLDADRGIAESRGELERVYPFEFTMQFTSM